MSAAVKASPQGVPGAVSDPATVRAQDITFAGAERTPVNGYLATPAAGATGAGSPAMIVIHEAGGLGEHIKDVTNRFANLGFGLEAFRPPPLMIVAYHIVER